MVCQALFKKFFWFWILGEFKLTFWKGTESWCISNFSQNTGTGNIAYSRNRQNNGFKLFNDSIDWFSVFLVCSSSSSIDEISYEIWRLKEMSSKPTEDLAWLLIILAVFLQKCPLKLVFKIFVKTSISKAAISSAEGYFFRRA